MQAVRSNEPIPGYTVRERIGAGGYGEVWRADAPGGLVKAIKFVYGYLDEDRASRELKALNRIKAVRHPFLLSLERIEVVEGQLIIVTELADGSLKDRFDECRKEELPGIPRDELIIYLRDAADALDYMSEHHSLQHLDVKPENLLLVGGRVKVADFGLVKELQDVTCSLMGGLTPLYAPPESFDGRPSRRSDQYSLAIVYQEMLTGVLPFPGTSAAQLAAQHLHSRPRLNTLPEGDQVTIGQALAKDPDDRFPSCRAMVDRLCSSVSVALPEKAPAEESGESRSSSVGATRLVMPTGAMPSRDEIEASASSARRSSRQHAPIKVSVPQANPEPKVVSLPPVELQREQIRLCPMVLLGVGGTATHALARLRQMMYDRFGGMHNVPSIRMLLMDTDSRALMRSTQGDEAVAVDPRETLTLPLRKPQDYRNTAGKLLKSMSRRWLYNIPRSLLTEGLRPLGRLAFVDHQTEIERRIRETLAAVREPASLTATSEKTGLEMDDSRIRIVVVSSIAGGTGSGMLVDLAATIRLVCNDMDIEQYELIAALTHSTSRTPSARELAIVNTFAFLHEWRHYNREGNRYPGDPACGLPPGKKGRPTFDSAYLYHLGDELDDRAFTASTDLLARRLFLEAASPAAGFFEQCRETDQAKEEGEQDAGQDAQQPKNPQLRTCGLVRVSSAVEDDLPQAAEYLARRIVDRWLGNEADTSAAGKLPDDEEVDRLTGELAAGLGLDCDALIKEAHVVVAKQFDGNPDAVVARVVAEALPQGTGVDEAAMFAHRSEILEALETLFDPNGAETNALMTAMAAYFTSRADKHAAAVDGWVMQLLDGSRARTRGSLRAAEWIATHLRNLQEQLQEIQKRLETQRSQLDAAIQAATPARSRRAAAAAPTLERLLVQFVQLRYYGLAVQGARGMLHAMLQRTATTIGGVKELRQELMAAIDEFERVDLGDNSEAVGWDNSPAGAAIKALRQRSAELIARIDRHMRDEFFAPQGGMLAATGSLRGTLPNVLRTVGRRAVRSAQSRGDVIERLLSGENDGRAAGLRDALKSATPSLLSSGGATRLLAVLPYGCSPKPLEEALQQDFEEPATVVMDGTDGAALCYEVEQLDVNSVAATILDERRDLAEVASRLHTRNDIDFDPWDK